MQENFHLLLILLMTVGVDVSHTASVVRREHDGACGCTTNYEPVCAHDSRTNTKRTHSNPCSAHCAHQYDHVDGPCPAEESVDLKEKANDEDADEIRVPPCVCHQLLSPVCAVKNGKLEMYSNDCIAKCDGVHDASQRLCDKEDLKRMGLLIQTIYFDSEPKDQVIRNNMKDESMLPFDPWRRNKKSYSSQTSHRRISCSCTYTYSTLNPVCAEGFTLPNSNCAVHCGFTSYTVGACQGSGYYSNNNGGGYHSSGGHSSSGSHSSGGSVHSSSTYQRHSSSSHQASHSSG